MGVLTGCSICFTGAANTPRATLVKMAEKAGAEVKKGVVKGLGLLVIADPNSSSAKAKAAREMGIKLISEEDFLEMVK
jgi:NAD-dependent DNA ligase